MLKHATENRAAFMARLEPVLAPSDFLNVQLAYTLAKYGHRAQVRREVDSGGQQLRYFEHVRRVALVLIDEVRLLRPEMVMAALLHDGIEDTRDLTAAMIEHCFGPDVTRLVMALSKVPKEGYIDRLWACDDWRAYVIKACDRLDNLRSLGSDEAFVKKQVLETREHYLPIFDRMVDLAPPYIKQRVSDLRFAVVAQLETLERDLPAPIV